MLFFYLLAFMGIAVSHQNMNVAFDDAISLMDYVGSTDTNKQDTAVNANETVPSFDDLSNEADQSPNHTKAIISLMDGAGTDFNESATSLVSNGTVSNDDNLASTINPKNTDSDAPTPISPKDDAIANTMYDGLTVPRIANSSNDNETSSTLNVITNKDKQNEKIKKKKCIPLSSCFKDEDCAGQEGNGRCLGAFVGKCDCSACMSGLPCISDATCGGLNNSCGNGDEKNAICDCIKGHKLNGFANYGQALLTFCNRRDCDGQQTNACHGLPCRRGHCFCPKVSPIMS